MSRHNRITLAILAVSGASAVFWGALAVWVVPGIIESGWLAGAPRIVNAAFAGWDVLWPGMLLNLLGLGVLVAILARPETWALARRAFGSTATQVFHAAPKMAIALVLVSAAVREWYPLSHFAMYSTFASSGGYLFLTNERDEPIASYHEGGVWLDEVQKIFNANLADERARRSLTGHRWSMGGARPTDEVVEAAAVLTLRYLQDERFEDPVPLRLWRTRIILRDGAISRERYLLGEVPEG